MNESNRRWLNDRRDGDSRRQTHLLLKTTLVILITTMSLSAHSSGRLQYFLTGDSISDNAQRVNFNIFEDQEDKPDTKTGSAFLYDSNFGRGGAFSLDYYTLQETYEEEEREVRDDQITLVTFGYRHHFPLNLYFGIGAGIFVVDHIYYSYTDESTQSTATKEEIDFLPTITPAFTVGWTYVSPIRLALGIHYLRTSPTTLTSDDAFQNQLISSVQNPLCDNPTARDELPPGTCDPTETETKKIDNFDVNLFGITIGFAW